MSEAKQSGKSERSSAKGRRTLSAVALVLCIVFAFTLVCNLAIIVKGSLFPEKPPSVLGVTPMVVLSGSMSGDAEDHIEVGDLIFVGKAEAEELKTGDIIAFMEGKMVVTHRIIEVQSAQDGSPLFITKGDADNAADQNPVSAEQLVGIYRFRIPKVGDFAMFLQTPAGMVLFIGIPVLAYVIVDVIRRRQTANRERQRDEQLQAELERLRKLAGEDR